MSDTITSLRAEALRVFAEAIKAADPAAALRRQFEKAPIKAPRGKLIIIAVGKAATPMMTETLRNVPRGVRVHALAVTNRENLIEIDGATCLPAGHPVPDADGEIAAQAVMSLLAEAGHDDAVIALISGGGSALLPAPVAPISLADKAQVSKHLLAAGCDIEEINEVRQQLSALKGGGFLRHAAPAPVSSYILSDVVGDDLRAIASGPTVRPIGTRASARALLEKYDLFDKMPASVQHVLNSPQPDHGPLPAVQNTLICSNRQSLEAMRDAVEGHGVIVNDRLEGNVAEVGPALVEVINDMPRDEPLALLFGGETTVTLTGTGMGGRNQDLALRVALQADQLEGDWVFLSGGTDGRDGPTDAAGGLVDAGTVARITRSGADAAGMLANNDAYHALERSEDLIIIGGTGTNVADVQIFLRA